MKRFKKSALIAGAVVAFATGGMATAFAQDPGTAHDTPGAPPAGASTRAHASGVTVRSEVVPVKPCRASDTRSATAGTLQPGATRLIRIAGTVNFPAQGGTNGGCGVPVGATAAVVSISSTQAGGNGYLRAWANGTTEPTATVLNWTNLGNAGITTGATVPISSSGYINIKGFNSSSEIVIDVTGYLKPPIFTALASGGGILTNSIEVTSASKVSTGNYNVNLSTPIDGCAITATGDNSYSNVGGYALDGDTVRVYSRDLDTGNYIDAPTFLTVTC